MDDTPRLSLPQIISGQALKHITHNEALMRLDALVQASVEASTVTAPPATPLDGEAWIVPASATGAWAGHGEEIAAFQAGAWTFYDPAPGWQVFDKASGTLCIFSGTGWIAVAATGAGLPQLGINADADTTNRLSISADATLLNHDGAGHQLKLNKATSGDTASLLFQSNWSGRAEMGLLADNAWRLKISSDGSIWSNALVIAGDGSASFAGALKPLTDNAQTLGASGARWSAVWSATGTIQTSDKRLKTDIFPSDLGLDFILALNPVRYRWRDNAADERVHYGLLAQEVLATARAHGAPNFGGHVLVDDEDADSQQALRYSSFIAPVVAAVQALAERVHKLESGL
ncbi:hypothetical protein ASD83_16120 [Devosia sp. Root685]|uniref:DUF2793 domain-containing protein n=1 Tax=Devosia sp. Root685 TaxID=1736587 RepID=UPI000701E552|nr:DUF2793 domain-containing protein [Devosia sp. Root685]KRA96620.1 hypothetical protein ASD83_16120 [Devosia sp. Root685]